MTTTAARPATTGHAGAGTTGAPARRRARHDRRRPAGRHHPHRLPDAGRHARPDRHAGPRRLRADRPVLRVPRHARRRRRARSRPRRVVGAQRGRHGVDVQAAPGRQVAGRRPTSRRPTWRPRWTAWSSPPTPASPASSPRAPSTPPTRTSPCSTSRAPNGNFPYLVSVFNAQTLDHAGQPTRPARRSTARRTAPGRGSSTSYDPATGASFERNPDWWGGQTPLDGQEMQFFGDVGTMVTAMQGGAVDALVQFSVLGGDALLEQPRLHRARGASRRRTARSGCAATPASSSTRPCARRWPTRSTASRWSARCSRVGPRSPTTTSSPRSCRSSTRRSRRSGPRTSRWPGSCSPTPASKAGCRPTLHAAELQEIPELAQLIQAGAAEAGINLELAIESLDTFYGAQWCPAEPADPPCSGAAELGIVDYGHRPTPDVFLNAALKTNGVWNSSQYSNPALDDGVHGVPAGGRRRRPDRGGRRRCRRSSTTRCRSACRSSTTTCPATRTASRASGCRRSGRCSRRRRRRSDRAEDGASRAR